MEYFGDEETLETRKFIRHFDRFFDCMNVRCTSEGIHRRKPDLRPYRDPSDPRLSVSGILSIVYMYMYYVMQKL
jgi:hypothetical protein